jgi:hypothetical protein
VQDVLCPFLFSKILISVIIDQKIKLMAYVDKTSLKRKRSEEWNAEKKQKPYGFIMSKIGLGDKEIKDIETPNDYWELLLEEFGPLFDPCPLGCTHYDGLKEDWPTDRWVFCNPPFSEVPKWLNHALSQCIKGVKTIFLVPARVNSRYWMNKVWPFAKEIRIYRQFKFPGYKFISPFPVSLLILDGDAKKNNIETICKKNYEWIKIKL